MWDEHSCFVTLKCNGGNDNHNRHPKFHDPSTIPIPTRLLDNEEEETVQHVVEFACNKAGRKYMFCQLGKFIS